MSKKVEVNTIEDLQNLVRSGFSDWNSLGFIKVIENGRMLLFNYTPEAAYQENWKFIELISRGLIIDKLTGEIIARPFSKFFNWNQSGRKAPYDAHIKLIMEKMDGSLGILYRDPNEPSWKDSVKIATRGSFASDQAMWATEWFRNNVDFDDFAQYNPNYTFLFEIIYPSNRIVVDYDGYEGLTLLAIRNRKTGKFLDFYTEVLPIADKLGFDVPTIFGFNDVTSIIEAAGKNDDKIHEGWVVFFSNGDIFKFKTDRYIEAHHAVSNLSIKNVVSAYKTDNLKSVKQYLPDEFIVEFNKMVTHIQLHVDNELSLFGFAFQTALHEGLLFKTRKEYAKWVFKNYPEMQSLLFKALDIYDQPGSSIKDVYDAVEKLIVSKLDYTSVDIDGLNA